MRESNYRFNCLPDPSRVTGVFTFTVDVREDFIEFAKQQKLDHIIYENEGIRILNSCGFNNDQIHGYGLDSRGIYSWDQEFSGLLRGIDLPGWEENNIELSELGRGFYLFGTHNLDSVEQFAAGFLLLNKWLREIDLKISN